MSWDIFVQHLPASAIRVADVPDDFTPLPLGSRADVIAALAGLFPMLDASDPEWLRIETPRWTIEIGLAAADPVTSIALHVRGDESVIPAISALIDRLGARAIDSWTGEFFDPATAAESLRRWRAYIEESV